MKTRAPAAPEIEALVAFLPRLYSQGFTPIKEWGGDFKDATGSYVSPWPIYDEVTEAFFQTATKDCWTAHSYDPARARQALADESFVASANLEQVKEILTYCVRGERFCDGHWDTMIRQGHVLRLLMRLSDFCSKQTAPSESQPIATP